MKLQVGQSIDVYKVITTVEGNDKEIVEFIPSSFLRRPYGIDQNIMVTHTIKKFGQMVIKKINHAAVEAEKDKHRKDKEFIKKLADLYGNGFFERHNGNH